MSKSISKQKTEKDFLKSWVREKAKQISYTPASTYRLQLHPKHMNFFQAAERVSYLKAIGVDTLYLSPCFEAVHGSEHGYDIVDPNIFRKDLGGREGFYALSDKLKKYRLGLVLDVIPNHMGIMGGQNKLWMDVLEFGKASEYSDYFDIDWHGVRSENSGKVLIPILGDVFGKVLEKKEIKIIYKNNKLFVQYWEHVYPANPSSYAMILKYDMDRLKERLIIDSDLESYLEMVRAFEKIESVNDSQRKKQSAEDALTSFAKLMSTSFEVDELVQENIRKFNSGKASDLLENFLNRQNYRLSYWRIAAEEINYRRFFDINAMAAIRMEKEEVFDFYHETIFKLIEEGRVQGLRIDHPDGLYNPGGYFSKLQEEVLMRILLAEENLNLTPKDLNLLKDHVAQYVALAKPAKDFLFYVVVEKILDRKESLPEDWKISGSVGYAFLNALNHLYIKRDHEAAFNKIYSAVDPEVTFDFEKMVYQSKKIFGLIHMAGEVHSLAIRLKSIALKNRFYRDYTLNHLTVAIREVIACFPVYRSYTCPETGKVSEQDKKYIHIAIEKAKRKTPSMLPEVYDYFKQVLLLEFEQQVSPAEREEYVDFVMRFQQMTAPILAKGLEDTLFYTFYRFISVNEVGGDPGSFGISRREFHMQNVLRQKTWPSSLLATSTHDTKRSEDIRMRLNALSEIPEAWFEQMKYWSKANESQKIWVGDSLEPDFYTEYFIYQTLVGAMPSGGPHPEKEYVFLERVQKYFEKAFREAKVKTSWISPDVEYEAAIKEFLARILKPSTDNAFLKSFLPFQQEIARLGSLNSLSSMNLKAASPGVFDVYQGTELWNLKLVDPDNRAEVNFEMRESMIRADEPDDLMQHRGIDKFLMLRKALYFRKKHKGLMIKGSYIPVEVQGERSRNVIAFIRKRGKYLVLAVSARFFTELDLKDPEKTWAGTYLVWPLENLKKKFLFSNIYTEAEMEWDTSKDIRIPVAQVLASEPCALFYP